jgi:glycosyltransferase involved in cell wall biosynthesis
VKIAHLVISGAVAGGQIVALRLARRTRAAGHDVLFVAPEEGEFTELARGDGFAVNVLPFSGALDLRAILRLRSLLRRERVDVLHTHTMVGGNVVGRVAGRSAGARVISHVHIENAFRAGPGRRPQILLDNLTARLAHRIVAVSDATRTSLVRQGYPAHRVVTIRNGVDEPEPIEPLRLADGPIVLEVARLAEVKGQRELIHALAGLDATGVLVGRDFEQDGAFERQLAAEVERAGARVVLAGYRPDAAALIEGCDVFCLPSHAEGLPLVLLEAMSRGKPVVASAVGGTPELVQDGQTGLLVPPGDVEALREALRRLLDDRELARRLGTAGAQRVRDEFSGDAAAARVLGLYVGGT